MEIIFSSDDFTWRFFVMLANVGIFILGSGSQNPTMFPLMRSAPKAFISALPNFLASSSLDDISDGITTLLTKFERDIASSSELNGFTMTDSKVVTRLFTSISSLLILALPPSLCLVLSLSSRIPHICFVAVVTVALSCAVRNHLSSAPSFLDMPIIPPFVFELRLTLCSGAISVQIWLNGWDDLLIAWLPFKNAWWTSGASPWRRRMSARYMGSHLES